MSDKFKVGSLTVRIEQDTDASNPRTEWDNAGHMVCWHRRYRLGDEHNFDTPEDFRESEDYKKAAVILPLYLYDHSGITMSCAAFSCPWDSGQVGYIYMSRAEVLKEWGGKGQRLTKQVKERAEKYLQGEVETYDQYLTGDVWGFIIEDSEGNDLDSCWGFYGQKYCEEEARSVANGLQEGIDKAEKMEREAFAL